MAIRSTMKNLVTRVRLLINDPGGASQNFSDDDIQDVLDATRQDYRYLSLAPAPTYSGSTITFKDYYANITDWEDDVTLWQYRTTQVIPATSENIPGHWTFTNSTLPPVFLVGKSYDVYRASADLLERLSAKWALAYSFSTGGQSFQRNQAFQALQMLAHSYRQKARPIVIGVTRTDLTDKLPNESLLAPQDIDYYGSGDGN